MSDEQEDRANVVLGQKYAYATAALMLGIASFVNLLGMEKAILAIIFARLALKSEPPPALKNRREWGQAGLVLGVLQVVLISVLIIIFRNELRQGLDLLLRLQDAK
ncbi:MAG TPA: hypothetical protein VLB68_32535 [Pyrinomonadaceae bacterium]|nr:hypothetical protein [Pyrinomonadaceae bacterium]